ncbi:MAG: T9SS type A sorting domain-containing protein [Bacteroidota bacterium]
MRIQFLLLVLTSLLLPQLSATTVTWTGNTSSDWSDPSNWDCSCLPGTDDNVSIPVGSFVDLADDADLQIRSLSVRGNLFIEDGSTLRIDSQNDESAAGLSVAAGNLVNNGELLIANTDARNAIYINTGASFTNGGTIQIGVVRCTSGSCNLQDVVVVNGVMENSGALHLAGVIDMEGFVVRGMLYNEGTIQIDTISTSGSVVSFSQASSFVNATDGSLLLWGIEGGSVSRAINNTQDSVQWENAGTIQIIIADQMTTGISLGGEGTTILNTGSIEVHGGATGLRFNEPDSIFNQGEIRLRGQHEVGIRLQGGLTFQNIGQVLLQAGVADRAWVFIGTSPGPQLLNSGLIRMEEYLLPSTFNRGFEVFTGRLVNEGDIYLSGAGDGRGIEMGTDAAPLENQLGGTIFLNHFDFGLQHETSSINAGTLIMAEDLGDAIVDNDVPLINSGTLAGGSIYRDGMFDLMPSTVLSPGTSSTVSRQTFAGELILPETVTINLDLANTAEAPEANDNVRSSRAFQFSGTLNINLAEAFSVNSGSFELLKGSGSAGGFTGEPIINLPEPPEGSAWRLEQTDTRLILHLDVINSTETLNEEGYLPQVFPNPVAAGQDWTIRITAQNSIAKLYNTSGQLLQTQKLNFGDNRFPTAGLAAGYYVLAIGAAKVPLVIQ